MKYNPYSYSKLKKYKECPLKFKRRYVDGIKEPPSFPAVVGSVFHEFAFLYDSERWKVNSGQPIPKIVDGLIQKAVYNAEIQLPLDAVADVTALCRGYSLKNLPIKNLIGLEMKFAFKGDNTVCDYDDKDALLRGIIDMIWVHGGEAVIVDRKTSRKASPDVFQMGIYSQAALMMFPQIGATSCRFDFERLGGWVETLPFDHHTIIRAKHETISLIHKCESDNDFKPTPSKEACRWCKYWSNCYKVQQTAGIIKMPETEEEINDIIARYIGCEKHKEQITEILKEYVDIFGEVTAMGRTFKFSSTPGWRGVNPVTLMLALKVYPGLKWWKAVNVNWKEVRTMAEQNKEIKGMLDTMGTQILTQRFTTSGK